MNRWTVRWWRPVVGAALMITTSGCSFVFVTPPKSNDGGTVQRSRAGDCTGSNVAPVLDSVFGGLQVARTALAVATDESEYSGAPISREADIAFGVAFTALFVSSAVYGFGNTSSCRKLREAEEERAAAEVSMAAVGSPLGPPVPLGDSSRRAPSAGQNERP